MLAPMSAAAWSASPRAARRRRSAGGRPRTPGEATDRPSRRPAWLAAAAGTTASGQPGDKDDEDEDDDDEKAEMAVEDAGAARTQEQKQEEIRLRAMLVEAFDKDQYDRYELWRAAKLSDAVTKRVSLLS